MTSWRQITSLTIVYSSVFFRRRSKKTSKLHVTDLCEGNPPVTAEFPAQRPSNAKKCFHLMASSWSKSTEVNSFKMEATMKQAVIAQQCKLRIISHDSLITIYIAPTSYPRTYKSESLCLQGAPDELITGNGVYYVSPGTGGTTVSHFADGFGILGWSQTTKFALTWLLRGANIFNYYYSYVNVGITVRFFTI